MNFADYEDFIWRRMRMSHIYQQAVTLMALLEGDGTASTRRVAQKQYWIEMRAKTNTTRRLSAIWSAECYVVTGWRKGKGTTTV